MSSVGHPLRRHAHTVAVFVVFAGLLAAPTLRAGLSVPLALLAGSAAAAGICIYAARAAGPSLGPGWTFLGLSWAAWVAAAVLQGPAIIGRHNWLPARLLWPLVLAGEAAAFGGLTILLTFTERAALIARRLRVVDASLVAAGTFFLVAVSARAGWSPMAHSPLGAVAAVAGASAVTLVVVYLACSVRAAGRARWCMLAASQLLTGVAIAAPVGAGRFGGRNGVWDLHTAAWLLGGGVAGMVAMAAARSPVSGNGRHRADHGHPLLDLHVPLGAVAVIVAAGAAATATGEGVQTIALIAAAFVLGLLLVRQAFVRADHLQLTQRLERRVKERTEELRLRERRFRSLVTNASDVVTLVDARGVIRYQSDSVERILGYSPSALVGCPAVDMVAPDQQDELMGRLSEPPPADAAMETVELRLIRADGTACMTETTLCNLLHEPSVEGILLTSRDVGDRRRLEDELRRQAALDPLTGLGNRTVLYDRLHAAIARSGHAPQQLALLLLDLDGFKQVNDNLGHAAGDTLLIEVARRLLDSVRPGDTVARMGGDEFAVMLESQHVDVPEIVAQRILNRLKAPLGLCGSPFVISASIGIAHGWSADVSGEELMRRADLAMYSAKSKGKNRYQIFQRSMQADARARMELEADLLRALVEGELCPYYQPIVDLRTGRISGAEALVRWLHPQRGLVPPDVFVPVAEESDLVLRIGRVMLEEACKEAARCQRLFPSDPPFTVSVNVAARQLVSDGLVEDVAGALESSGLDPSCLILEITEGALMERGPAGLAAVGATIEALRRLGVRLAIDDFGTGWSSLSRLRSLPVHELKIDRAFVSEISSSDAEAPLVDAIVAMGHSLHLQIVAEGVETLDQLSYLHLQGVEAVQGYLLSRPLSQKKLESLLADPVWLVTSGGAPVGVHYGAGGNDAQRRQERRGDAVEVVPLLVPDVGSLPGERRFRPTRQFTRGWRKREQALVPATSLATSEPTGRDRS